MRNDVAEEFFGLFAVGGFTAETGDIAPIAAGVDNGNFGDGNPDLGAVAALRRFEFIHDR